MLGDGLIPIVGSVQRVLVITLCQTHEANCGRQLPRWRRLTSVISATFSRTASFPLTGIKRESTWSTGKEPASSIVEIATQCKSLFWWRSSPVPHTHQTNSNTRSENE